jgi:hypothetical protein
MEFIIVLRQHQLDPRLGVLKLRATPGNSGQLRATPGFERRLGIIFSAASGSQRAAQFLAGGSIQAAGYYFFSGCYAAARCQARLMLL